jgi:phosphotransferase system HPr (HPr) family protein
MQGTMTYTAIVTVDDQLGLHARPAAQIAKLVKSAIESNCDLMVTVSHHSGRQAQGKSALMLMALGAKSGDSIEVQIDGATDEEATALVAQMQGFLSE